MERDDAVARVTFYLLVALLVDIEAPRIIYLSNVLDTKLGNLLKSRPGI